MRIWYSLTWQQQISVFFGVTSLFLGVFIPREEYLIKVLQVLIGSSIILQVFVQSTTTKSWNKSLRIVSLVLILTNISLFAYVFWF